MGQTLQKIKGKHLGKCEKCQLCSQPFSNPLKFGIFYVSTVKAHLCKRCGRYVCIKCAPKDQKKQIIGFQDELPHTFCNICIVETNYNVGLVDSIKEIGQQYLKYIRQHQSQIKNTEKLKIKYTDNEIEQRRQFNSDTIEQEYQDKSMKESGLFIEKQSLIISENVEECEQKQEHNIIEKIPHFNYSIREFLYILQSHFGIESDKELVQMVQESLLKLNKAIPMFNYSSKNNIEYIIPILLGFTEYKIDDMGLHRQDVYYDYIELQCSVITDLIEDMLNIRYEVNIEESQNDLNSPKQTITRQLSESQIQQILSFVRLILPFSIQTLLLNCLGIKCIHYLWTKIFQQNSILPLEQCIQALVIINMDLILEFNELEQQQQRQNLDQIYILILRNTTLHKLQYHMFQIEQVTQMQQNLRTSLLTKKNSELEVQN